jgi:hypothetical protein
MILVSFLVYMKVAHFCLFCGGVFCSMWFGLVCVFFGYCYAVLFLCIAICGSYLSVIGHVFMPLMR